jgi:hypothetical protein
MPQSRRAGSEFSPWRAPLAGRGLCLDEQARHGYVSPYGLAYIHVALGEKDEAFVLLNKAHEERSSDVIDLKVDPQLDPLRSDPRFAELLRRMGFSP